MAIKFVEIYDSNKRNQIIEENLNELQNQITQNKQGLLKTIVKSNEQIQNQLLEDRDKIVETLNNFSHLQTPTNQSRNSR